MSHVVSDVRHPRESLAVVATRLSDGQVWSSNEARADRRFSPASTAKIPHSLIALDEGLVNSETVFAWDGVIRSRSVWNRNQTLKGAFQSSAVWVFQHIVRLAGAEVMAQRLAQFGYGNADIGGPEQLATYWLDGTLRISAWEQVDFLSRLAREELSVSPTTYAAAKNIMHSDSGENWEMWSKTGWHHRASAMDIGWFVGRVACGSDTYVIALNMDLPDTRFLSARKAKAYAVLTHIGAFDCS